MSFVAYDPHPLTIMEHGNQYGELSVLDKAPNVKAGQAYWNCRCSCGQDCIVLGNNLRNGKAKICPRCSKTKAMRKVGIALTINEVDNIYGKLTVRRTVPIADYGIGARWLCECECGNFRIAFGYQLRQSRGPRACAECTKALRMSRAASSLTPFDA